jgi:hypothetical protein
MHLLRSTLSTEVNAAFLVEMTRDESKSFETRTPIDIRPVAPTIVVTTAAKPWGI